MKMDFNLSDTILKPGAKEVAYQSGQRIVRTEVLHWGQRKLLIGELYFLSLVYDDKSPATVVYIGAAPGTHIPVLAALFPLIEWHLYDPRDFNIPSVGKIHLYNRLFTEDDAEYWARVPGRSNAKIYLISDLRTANFRAMTFAENEQAVITDNRLQERIVSIMKPYQAHLKFRLPYYDERLINQGVFSQNQVYLDGIVIFQPWVGETSTETRLIPMLGKDNKYLTKNWDIKVYERQLAYHNGVTRIVNRYNNPFDKRLTNVVPGELLNDYDSSFEVYVYILYIFQIAKKNVSQNQVAYLANFVTDNIAPVKSLAARRLEPKKTSIRNPKGQSPRGQTSKNT